MLEVEVAVTRDGLLLNDVAGLLLQGFRPTGRDLVCHEGGFE
jgi:hypothetical protein